MMSQDKICEGAVFSVFNERAVERAFLEFSVSFR